MSMDSKFFKVSSNIRLLDCCLLADKNYFQKEKVFAAWPFEILFLGSFINIFCQVITYFQSFKSKNLFEYFYKSLENYFVAFSKKSAFASLFDYFKNYLNFDAGLASKDFILQYNIFKNCCMDTSFHKINPDRALILILNLIFVPLELILMLIFINMLIFLQ